MIALAPDEELRMADDMGEGFKGKFGPRRAGQERRSVGDRRKFADRRKPSNRRETPDRRT